MIPSSVGPSSGRGGCLRELWSSISCPLFRGRSIGRWPWEYNEPPFLFFFFLFFFWWLLRLGFIPPQLLTNGGMVCVSWPRVTPGLVEGLSVLAKLFNFPTFFEALPF